MRQVPHFLLIGNGRVARHFQHYFHLLKLSFTTWHRGESLLALANKAKQASHILLLVSDAAIDTVIQHHLSETSAILIHFSGSLVSEKAYGAHPLLGFNQHLYSLEDYLTIPFVIDDDAPAFDDLLPGLPNPHVRLKKSLKAKYHALCVSAGNFSCLLWQKLFTSFENELGLPHHIAHAYLKQNTQNLLTHFQTALTGPLVRGDTITINTNLAAFAGDPFQAVYASFVSCYQQCKEK